jgi:hypothetical protein
MVITINTGIINTSLQINDEIYCVPIDNSISGFATGDPIYIGRVINILGSKIEIKDPVMHTTEKAELFALSSEIVQSSK